MPGFTSRSKSAPTASRWKRRLEASRAAARILPTLVLAAPGCTPAAELALRQAAEPGAVAAAICREVRTAEVSACDGMRLADRASEIAYAACLDYNRRDLRACDRLRRAYEDDIRAQLAAQTVAVQTAAAQTTGAAATPDPDGRGAPGHLQAGSLKTGEPQPSAEALYKAANSDADTFQAALLIPEVRKKIEAALGKQLSDAQLRALIDHNREEAVYWYGRLTPPQSAREAAAKRPGG